MGSKRNKHGKASRFKDWEKIRKARRTAKQLDALDAETVAIEKLTQTVQDRYERNARILRIVDGDTLVLSVDQGFGTWYEAKFRLAGINTPEKYGVKKTSDEYKAGVAASEYAQKWIEENADSEPYETPLGKVEFPRVVIRSFDAGQGKYGRWICTVHPPSGEGESLNEALVRSGHAVEVSY